MQLLVHLQALSEHIVFRDRPSISEYTYAPTALTGPLARAYGDWCQQRGMPIIYQQSRLDKATWAQLKDMDKSMGSSRVVRAWWYAPGRCHVLLESGVLVTIVITIHSSDIQYLLIDKSLLSYRLSDKIADGLVCDRLSLLTYRDAEGLNIIEHGTALSRGDFTLRPRPLASLDLVHAALRLSDAHTKDDARVGVNTLEDCVVVWWPNVVKQQVRRSVLHDTYDFLDDCNSGDTKNRSYKFYLLGINTA
jgi:hypothetical protein